MISVQNDSLVSFLQKEGKSSTLSNISICLCGVAGLSALAQISLPLPFTPVPITAQTFGVIVMGSSFGGPRAILTTLLYVCLGLAGAPVFSEASSGMGILLGPTGGYLVGFVASAYVMGKMSERKLDRKFKTSLPLFLVGHLIIFLCGLAGLSQFVSLDALLQKGFYPFIPGMLIKTALAGLLTPTVWKLVKAS